MSNRAADTHQMNAGGFPPWRGPLLRASRPSVSSRQTGGVVVFVRAGPRLGSEGACARFVGNAAFRQASSSGRELGTGGAAAIQTREQELEAEQWFGWEGGWSGMTRLFRLTDLGQWQSRRASRRCCQRGCRAAELESMVAGRGRKEWRGQWRCSSRMVVGGGGLGGSPAHREGHGSPFLALLVARPGASRIAGLPLSQEGRLRTAFRTPCLPITCLLPRQMDVLA